MSDNILHLVSPGNNYAVNVGNGTGVIKNLTEDQKESLKKKLISSHKIVSPPPGITYVKYRDEGELNSVLGIPGGSRRARRPSRKYKKSAKRVFRKKSRSTRRR